MSVLLGSPIYCQYCAIGTFLWVCASALEKTVLCHCNEMQDLNSPLSLSVVYAKDN